MNNGICNKSGKPVECNLTADQLKDLGTVNLYVKCKTAEGKTNPDLYKINTCVDQGPDLTAPAISQYTFPTNNGYSKFNADYQNVIIYVNEPSKCRWSTNPELTYEQMENQMTCDTNLNHYVTSENYDGGVLIGLPCNATFTGLKNNTEYYIKCKDLSENNNTMTQNFVYNIKITKSPLIIEDFIPKSGEEIMSGRDTTQVELKVQTSGGSENGISNCSWEDIFGAGFLLGDNFLETDTTIHTYTWKSAPKGYHNVKFTCEDAGGNIATNKTMFKIFVDNYGPKIVRVYNDGGLKIVTDEKSICAYNYSKNFNFDNSSLLSGEYTYEHSGGWELDATYNIQCKDEYGNKGGIFKFKPFEIYT